MLGLLAWLGPPAAAAAGPLEGVRYDPEVPRLEQVLGHASGERMTPSADTHRYLGALAEHAPERVRIFDYAVSWEGRQLKYAVIGKAAHIAKLDEIKAALSRLGSGQLSGEEAKTLAASTPAVSWMSYGVHGNEISSPDAALALAYHLLAAQGDATVDAILAETLVVIDPIQNPDGRDRFIHGFRAAYGIEPSDDRYTAGHDEPWPTGRVNHYLFDMNRDWFNLSQPETRGRVAAIQTWHPVVVVDAHEMSGDSTYFFPPAAEPYNPNLTPTQRENQVLMGRNNARWFDRLGIPYFTRETFDNFYPGYGDMWPQLNGAIAMTFEQASPRGLRFRRLDGSVHSYADAVRAHFVASLGTIETVATHKAALLRSYAQYRRDAREWGVRGGRYTVIDLATRRWQAERLAQRLVAQGVAVRRVSTSFEACRKRYPKGGLVVDRAQPNGRLIATLLDVDTPLPKAFIERQEARRARALEVEMYDVTAWSLPLMSGVDAVQCASVPIRDAEAVGASGPIPSVIGQGASTFGYVVPWSDAGQAKLTAAALRSGARARTADEAFTRDGRIYPQGSVIFAAAENPRELPTQLVRMAREIGAEVVPLESSWVDSGPNFGSENFHVLRPPRVALAWGEGVWPTSAGATRFVLEQELGIPVAPIRVRTLRRADLEPYDVVIVPEVYPSFMTLLGERGPSSLRSWVHRGGVLVALGSGLSLLTQGDEPLLATKSERAVAREAQAKKEKKTKKNGGGDTPPKSGAGSGDSKLARGLVLDDSDALRRFTTAKERRPDEVPGALLRVTADTDHWLAAGYEGATVLLEGNEIYQPLKDDMGRNVFFFSGPDDLLASGLLWKENRKQLAYKPFVMVQEHGRGMVIGFTQSPMKRAYLHGLTLLVANAVVLAPAHTQKPLR